MKKPQHLAALVLAALTFSAANLAYAIDDYGGLRVIFGRSCGLLSVLVLVWFDII